MELTGFELLRMVQTTYLRQQSSTAMKEIANARKSHAERQIDIDVAEDDDELKRARIERAEAWKSSGKRSAAMPCGGC